MPIQMKMSTFSRSFFEKMILVKTRFCNHLLFSSYKQKFINKKFKNLHISLLLLKIQIDLKQKHYKTLFYVEYFYIKKTIELDII